MSGEGLTADEWASIIATLPEVGLRTREPLLDAVERIVARRESEAAEKALQEAADAIQAMHPGEVKNSVIWLRARADSVAQGREEGRDGV